MSASSEDVILIVDRLVPRLGMEKAVLDVVPVLARTFGVHVLAIAEAGDVPGAKTVVSLGSRSGLRGRLAALRPLRANLRQGFDGNYVAVGIWAYLTVFLACIGLKRSLRLVLWEHSMLPWRLAHEPKVLIAGLLLRFTSMRISAVVSVSSGSAEATKRLIPQRVPILVIPNPIIRKDHALPGEHIGSDASLAGAILNKSHQVGEAVHLLGIGSLIPRKNWKMAIEAMQFLPENYLLKIAGSGKTFEDLKALVRKLSLEGRVELMGYQTDVPSLLRETDVVVHPSWAETYGYSILEARQFGLPVVCLDMPVMDETLHEFRCGELVRPYTAEAFAQAVRTAAEAQYDFGHFDGGVREENLQEVHIAWRNVLIDAR